MGIRDKVLVVEDDKSISHFLCSILEANGYNYLTAYDGKKAYALISSHCPDLILLDLGLPDIDGLEIIKMVREWTTTPIIVVSSRIREKDKVEALDCGADDYITKPFGTAELLARIRTAMRHTRFAVLNREVAINGRYCVGGLVIDYDKYRVFIDGNDANLTQNEYKLVALLGKFAGKVLTYDFIIREIWGPIQKNDNQILRVNMANIRRKIEQTPSQPQYIITEAGVGYRMIDG